MSETNQNQNKNTNKQSIFTPETFGVVIVLFATLILICLISRDAIFSVPGLYVNKFFFGLLGYSAYAVSVWAIFMGVLLITGKKTGLTLKRKLLISFSVGVLFLIIHVITMHADTSLSYGEYLVKAYNMGAGGVVTSSGGGIIIALVAFLVSKMLTSIGSYVVLSAVLALLVYTLVKDILHSNGEKRVVRGSYMKEEVNATSTKPEISGERDYPIEGVAFPNMNTSSQGLFVSNPNDFAFKSKKDLKNEERAKTVVAPAPQTSYSKTYSTEMQEKLNYIKTPHNINPVSGVVKKPSVEVSKPIPTNTSTNKPISSVIPVYEHEEVKKPVDLNPADAFYGKYIDFDGEGAPTGNIERLGAVENERKEEIKPQVEINREPVRNIPFIEENDISEPTVTDKPEEVGSSRIIDAFGTNKSEPEVKAVGEPIEPKAEPEKLDFTATRRRLFEPETKPEPKVEEKVEEEKPVEPPINMVYNRPSLDLLETYVAPPDAPSENHDLRKEIIKKTLGEFHIEVEPQGHVQGPSITRYEVTMPAGVSVNKVVGREKELKLRLKCKDEVRVEAPIPGTDLVGIEVANETRVIVGMKEVLEGMAKKKIKPTALEFALGKDIVGDIKTDNLAKGPHYLVAGATGSGKSVCLDVMIISLIMRYSPEDLRLMLIDPKRVGFKKYEGLPHLLIPKVITEPQAALNALSWAIDEMERRYQLFEQSSLVVDLESYNEFVANDTVPKLPRIVIFFDELADFMETCKRDLEERIRRLAAKSRAAGIHLVLATQRPTVDVITGTIKTNLPSRVALKVMNFADSQTILSEGGAEALLGNGDMLFKNSSMASPIRIQGAYITSREINNVVTFIKENNGTYFDEKIDKYINKINEPSPEIAEVSIQEGGEDPEANELFVKALTLGLSCGNISISQLQRRFGVGYARAGRLIDQMEKAGYISGFEGAKPRKVLISREEFEAKYGNPDDIDY